LKGSQTGTLTYANALAWCFSLSERTASSASFLIKSALVQTIIWDKAKAQSNLDANVVYFLNNFESTLVGKGWPNRLLEYLLKIFSPGVWAYYFNFVEQQIALDSALGAVSGDYSWQGLQELVANTPFNIDISNIDWKDRLAVKESIERGSAIVKAHEQQLLDMDFDNSGNFY